MGEAGAIAGNDNQKRPFRCGDDAVLNRERREGNDAEHER
jgi:hypothetical protein